jgi:hypothetical protein
MSYSNKYNPRQEEPSIDPIKMRDEILKGLHDGCPCGPNEEVITEENRDQLAAGWYFKAAHDKQGFTSALEGDKAEANNIYNQASLEPPKPGSCPMMAAIILTEHCDGCPFGTNKQVITAGNRTRLAAEWYLKAAQYESDTNTYRQEALNLLYESAEGSDKAAAKEFYNQVRRATDNRILCTKVTNLMLRGVYDGQPCGPNGEVVTEENRDQLAAGWYVKATPDKQRFIFALALEGDKAEANKIYNQASLEPPEPGSCSMMAAIILTEHYDGYPFGTNKQVRTAGNRALLAAEWFLKAAQYESDTNTYRREALNLLYESAKGNNEAAAKELVNQASLATTERSFLYRTAQIIMSTTFYTDCPFGLNGQVITEGNRVRLAAEWYVKCAQRDSLNGYKIKQEAFDRLLTSANNDNNTESQYYLGTLMLDWPPNNDEFSIPRSKMDYFNIYQPKINPDFLAFYAEKSLTKAAAKGHTLALKKLGDLYLFRSRNDVYSLLLEWVIYISDCKYAPLACCGLTGVGQQRIEQFYSCLNDYRWAHWNSNNYTYNDDLETEFYMEQCRWLKRELRKGYSKVNMQMAEILYKKAANQGNHEAQLAYAELQQCQKQFDITIDYLLQAIFHGQRNAAEKLQNHSIIIIERMHELEESQQRHLAVLVKLERLTLGGHVSYKAFYYWRELLDVTTSSSPLCICMTLYKLPKRGMKYFLKVL